MRKMLITGMMFICLVPTVSAFEDVSIDIPNKIVGGSTYQINISFQGEDTRIPYYINTTITSINTPSIWMNDFIIGNCNETTNGTFICNVLSQKGYNSYSLNISSKPALYPGNYSMEVSLVGIMEIEDTDSSPSHNVGGTINICGDNRCEGFENCESCPEDCGECKKNETEEEKTTTTIKEEIEKETTTTIKDEKEEVNTFQNIEQAILIFFVICIIVYLVNENAKLKRKIEGGENNNEAERNDKRKNHTKITKRR